MRKGKKMIGDAHVHMGYYTRYGHREPFYYSPRRVLGVLDRCKVDEFIVSSTCAQVECISAADLHREAREMKRLAGQRAHLFLWVTGHLFDADPDLKALDAIRRSNGRKERLYEGIKLHECETPWYRCRRRDLMRIVEIANERNLPVQMHSGGFDGCKPSQLARIAKRFPNVRFDFAHCHDMKEMSKVVADFPNVWSDTAYLPITAYRQLKEYDWRGRLMFGSDLPVWAGAEDIRLTNHYRAYLSTVSDKYCRAFKRFLALPVN